MLDSLDELLRWYLAEARPLFREKGPVLFCDQSGGVMAFGTIRNRLAYLQQLEDGAGRGAVLAARVASGVRDA